MMNIQSINIFLFVNSLTFFNEAADTSIIFSSSVSSLLPVISSIDCPTVPFTPSTVIPPLPPLFSLSSLREEELSMGEKRALLGTVLLSTVSSTISSGIDSSSSCTVSIGACGVSTGREGRVSSGTLVSGRGTVSTDSSCLPVDGAVEGRDRSSSLFLPSERGENWGGAPSSSFSSFLSSFSVISASLSDSSSVARSVLSEEEEEDEVVVDLEWDAPPDEEEGATEEGIGRASRESRERADL